MNMPDSVTTPDRQTSVVRRPRRLPLAVYAITVGAFLMGTSEFVVAGLLPEMARDFGVSVNQAGLSITVFAIGMVIGPPAAAAATLRLPRRLTLSLALSVFAVAHVVASLGSDFTTLLVARFVAAIATGAYWGVAASVVAQLVAPELRGRALGVVLAGGMLANVLGVPLGAVVGQTLGWRGPFLALAALSAVGVLMLTRLVPRLQTSARDASILAELRALRSVRLWLTLAVCATTTAGVLSVYSYIAPVLTERAGLPATWVPLALALFGAGAFLGSMLGGRFGDARPIPVVVTCACVTTLTMSAMYLFSTNATIIVIAFTLLGLVGFSANPVLVTLAMRFGGKAPTIATAMPTSIFNLGTTMGTGVTGMALAGSIGLAAPALVGVVSSCILFVPLVALIAVERRRTLRM